MLLLPQRRISGHWREKRDAVVSRLTSAVNVIPFRQSMPERQTHFLVCWSLADGPLSKVSLIAAGSFHTDLAPFPLLLFVNRFGFVSRRKSAMRHRVCRT